MHSPNTLPQSLHPTSRHPLTAGVTALTLLVTPFLLQVSNRLTPRPKGWSVAGPGPGDLELSNGGPQVCVVLGHGMCLLLWVGLAGCWCVTGPC